MATASPDTPELDQAFWNDFMRKPEVREAYQKDKQLQHRKLAWWKEREAIREAAVQRYKIVDALEEASADIKKLIAPMFHIRVVEKYLGILLEECGNTGISFVSKLREEQTHEHLRKLREAFHEGGEARMQSLENEWYSVCDNMVEAEEKKRELKPVQVDVHTLKNILEFGQECRNEGNKKFKEGLYEEALHIYSQGDEMMKKYKVSPHLKNESKWFKDYHLTCLKNKAQAALKVELYTTALEATVAALRIDEEDVKVWYRKALAEKSLGNFEDAETSLTRLEDVAQWCQDRKNILKDCEAERQKIQHARIKHRISTQEMLEKAFEAGIFSADREKAELEAAARQEAERKAQHEEERKVRPITPLQPLKRSVQLTQALAGDLLDDLAEAYGERRFQERVRKCAHDSNFDKRIFLSRLKGVAFEIQKVIIERWGFEGSSQGIWEMTAAIRDTMGKNPPPWLKEKQIKCLELLYGGREFGGMAAVLLDT
eukprot:TRINITY_DN38578_c0_g2_i1.p1 TRINITY_DN38578_c0_g2~~TRINITY_DN38578_c0_g2_i1.p1  ORF type:complete len:487 (+),score=125.82 TRINITY_DN38578_c0_g2_i1:95-1555(+)